MASGTASRTTRKMWQLLLSLRFSYKTQYRLFLGLTILSAISAATWHFWIASALQKLPENFTYDASIISYDNLYNRDRASYEGISVSNNKLHYGAVSSRNNVLLIKNSFEARSATNHPIFAAERTYGIDRSTQKHVRGYGDKDRDGYLFAPPNLTKQDFTYWHINYDQPAHMRYKATEDILGLQTYHYNARYKADQTKELSDTLPDVGKTRGIITDVDLDLWVEPATGHLVKYEDKSTAFYYDLATGRRLDPWNQFSNRYSFESIVAHVRESSDAKSSRLLIDNFIPTFMWLIAIVMLVLWVRVILRHKRVKPIPLVLVRFGAIGSFTIGALVLIGWATNNTILTRINVAFTPMHPITAANFILVAVALTLMQSARTHRIAKIILYLILGSMAFSTMLYFMGYYTGIRLGVEDLLEVLKLPTVYGISPITQICFMLLSCALFTLTLPAKRFTNFVTQALLIVIWWLAAFSVAGYAFNLSYLYSIGWFSNIALHTAITFLFLATIIYASQTRWRIVQRFKKISRSFLLGFGSALIMMTFTGIAWQQAANSVSGQNDIQFQSDANGIQVTLINEFSSYIKALRGTRGLFAASEHVTRQEWKAHVDTLQLPQNYPGMYGLGFAKMVAPKDKAAHEAQIRKEGFPNYSIYPAGERSQYSSIIYLEPFNERNQRAFGYDMFSDPIRRKAMERARDTGEPAMSDRVTLVQETGEDVQSGLLIYLPVYDNNMPRGTIEQRRAALLGFVYTPLRMTDFMRSTLGEQTYGLNVELFDSDDSNNLQTKDRLFAVNSDYLIGEREGYTPRFVLTREFTVADQTLQLRFSSLPSYESGADSALPSIVLFGGLFVSILLGGFVFTLSSSRNRALRIADEMTLGLQIERNKAVISQEKDAAILSSIGDGVTAIDSSGNIILFNQAAESITRTPANSALGKQYKHILAFNTEKGSHSKDFIQSTLEGKAATTTHNVTLIRSDKTRLDVAVNVAPVLNGSRKVAGAVIVFRDISHEKQLERSKDEFLTIASHELRTPMGAIRAYIAMMLGGDFGPVNKGLREPLTDMKASTVRLVDLVNDLLDVSRIETGRMSYETSDFDLKPVLQNVIASFKPLYAEKKLKIKLEPTDKIIVHADADKTKNVLANLIGNATKFTEKGSVAIRAFKNSDDMAEVDIVDTGIGIAREDQSKLFAKFQQLSTHTGGKPPGTGLGLYIAQEIITQLGGRLWLKESMPGKGSTFAFTLPIAGTAKAQRVQKSLSKLTVLNTIKDKETYEKNTNH